MTQEEFDALLDSEEGRKMQQEYNRARLRERLFIMRHNLQQARAGIEAACKEASESMRAFSEACNSFPYYRHD